MKENIKLKNLIIIGIFILSNLIFSNTNNKINKNSTTKKETKSTNTNTVTKPKETTTNLVKVVSKPTTTSTNKINSTTKKETKSTNTNTVTKPKETTTNSVKVVSKSTTTTTNKTNSTKKETKSTNTNTVTKPKETTNKEKKVEESINYSDYKAILIGDSQGNILKKHNETVVRPLASITKVMTAMIVLDKLNSKEIKLDDKVKITEKIASIPYGVRLQAGKTFTVEDLLKATIIKSSNAAAYALGNYISKGNIENFVEMMNEKAKNKGWDSLRFCTPHGLPPKYTGSCMDQGNAKDLYKMALEIVKYKEYLEISKQKTATIDSGNIRIYTTNKLLGDVVGVDGIKTGYHDAAGSNIILSAKRNNNRVIVVILGSTKSKNRNEIGKKEINEYFEKISKENNATKEHQNKKVETKKINKIKIVDKNKAVQKTKIKKKEYELYPLEDIIIETEYTENELKIEKEVLLKENLTDKNKDKIVALYKIKYYIGNEIIEKETFLLMKEIKKN